MLRGKDRTIIEALIGPLPGEQPERAAVGDRHSTRAWRVLDQAGLAPARARRVGAAVGLIGAALCLAFHVWAGAVFVASSGVVLVLIVRWRIRRRRDELERDLPALLTTIASSVRAGIDPMTALIDAERFFGAQSVLGEGIQHFKRELQSGGDESDLLRGFLEALSSPDLELFKRCVSLSRRHGASLADPLHRVVKVVRQRQSFRRKTRAALAMHRMSAIGIALCATFIAGLQAAMNLSGISLAWQHPLGGKLLVVGLLLIAAGVGWMMSMGREEAL